MAQHWAAMLPDVERRLGLPAGSAQPCDIDGEPDGCCCAGAGLFC